jgi:NADPH:quinone reductase-like Zn-dependent oxidoreductase
LLFPHTGSASTIGTPLLIPLQVLLKFLAAPINPSDINQLEGAGGTAPLRGTVHAYLRWFRQGMCSR